MNHHVTATLVGTFLALVVATVWVPVRIAHTHDVAGLPQVPSASEHQWAWEVSTTPTPREFWTARPRRGCVIEEYRVSGVRAVAVDWRRLLPRHLAIVALGGLLSLFLSFRTRRGAAA